jgi:uncharacterized membrane protein
MDSLEDSMADLDSVDRTGEAEKAAAKANNWNSAEIVGRTIAVNVPRQQVYEFWRAFENFPSFMENIERVTKIDETRSRWVVSAPVGTTVEWEAVITEDVPGEVIAWESSKGASVRNRGRIEFRNAPPGHGVYITANVVYEPPGGEIGKLIAKLFRREPKIQARQDMRRLKQLLETGEVSTARRFKASDQSN